MASGQTDEQLVIQEISDDVLYSNTSQPVPLMELNQNQQERRRKTVKRKEKRLELFDNLNGRGACHGVGCCGCVIIFLCIILIIVTFPITIFFVVKIVQQYERAVILRLGHVRGGVLGTGLMCILPCVDRLMKVDMRTKAFDVPKQELLSKDSVTIWVDAVVYYHIYDANLAMFNVNDCYLATELLAQTTLRNVLGTKKLSEILLERAEIAEDMKEILEDATDDWGICVERLEIKDVRLPQNLQFAMAAEAEASRNARAKIIHSEGEMQASRMLLEASRTMENSPTSMELRYLQTLNGITGNMNLTVFPFPRDIVKEVVSSSKRKKK